MEKQDQKLKVLLGLTGSVATTLYKVLIKEIQEAGYDVDVILTESAKRFIKVEGVVPLTIQRMLSVRGAGCFTDSDEWNGTWTKGDPVMHIDMANMYSALVIAPCTANTLAKIANGICDNLLTSVVRAWPWYKPLILAPAMNTRMWSHPITQKHLEAFSTVSRHNHIVHPQSKMLACGTEGMGALGDIKYVVEALNLELIWGNPLSCRDSDLVVPVPPHPGAFGAPRNGHTHPGLDLYAEEGMSVDAVEDGEVVGIEHFTGAQDGSPWWENTECVMVQGASGVVNYGEITPKVLRPGNLVRRGYSIGTVKRVILKGHEHPEITGWKPSMLHLELYPWNATKSVETFTEGLHRDPTPHILKAVPLAKRVSWP